jgi:hypothetical protein
VKYSSGECASVCGEAMSGGSERDQSGGPRWLNDSKHDGAVAVKGRWRKKGRSTGGGSAPFIAGGGSWQRRHELRPWWWRW